MPLPARLPSANNKSVDKDKGSSKSKEVLTNRYTVERTLGSGNCGTALLVTDRKDKDDKEKLKVVKKVFIGSLQPDETVDAAHEARLLQSLDHPNIVKFYDSFIENEFFCIVTEFCDGGDLDGRIEEYKKSGQRFSEDQIIEWTIQLLMALQYMHSRRILHRDLKTRNIFLRSNRVKIGDFGISRILMGSAEMASTFVGTPFFMSPEVLKHDGYNSKSDIWSIGCILYELATLKHAFPATTLMGVMYKITEEPAPEWPDQYSDDLGELYRRIMEKNPDKRPSASEALNFPFVTRQIEMLKETVMQKYSARSHNDVITKDTEKIAVALKKNSKLADLQRESDEKRYRNLPPRDRMRLQKQEKADEEARRLALNIQLIQKERQAQFDRAKQQNDPYASTIAFGVDAARDRRAAAVRSSSIPFAPATAPQPIQWTSSAEVYSDEDEDSDNERTVVPQSAWSNRPHGRLYSDDDRPITPMKNTTIYSQQRSSLDPEEIPDNHDLANTYYEQYAGEFESYDEDEKEMFTELQSLISSNDELANEQTVVSDDKQAGAFGPGAKDIKIKNLRAKLITELGQDKFTAVYNYLKKVRFDDRRAGVEIDESAVRTELRKMIKKPGLDYDVETLLFLEMPSSNTG